MGSMEENLFVLARGCVCVGDTFKAAAILFVCLKCAFSICISVYWFFTGDTLVHVRCNWTKCKKKYTAEICCALFTVIHYLQLLPGNLKFISNFSGNKRRLDFFLHMKSFSFLFFFQLLSFRLAAKDHPSPSYSVSCIFLCHTNFVHALLHHMHEPPCWPSSSLPVRRLHPQQSFLNILCNPPLYLPKPPKFCLSHFVSLSL